MNLEQVGELLAPHVALGRNDRKANNATDGLDTYKLVILRRVRPSAR